MLSVDVNLDLFPTQIPSQVVNPNVFVIQTVARDMFARIRSVLRSQTPVTHPPVDLVLSVRSTLMEILSVDVNLVLFLNLTLSQVVDLNVFEIQIVTRDISAGLRDVLSNQIPVTPPLVVLILSVQTKEGTQSVNVSPDLSPSLTQLQAVTVNASQTLTVVPAMSVLTTNVWSVLIHATPPLVVQTPCAWKTG